MEKQILFIISDEEWKNVDKVYNYLDTIRYYLISKK